MKRPLEIVAGVLEDARETASDRARGRYGAHDVEVRFVDRGAGSTRDPYTEVWFLGAARRADLRLHVIPQTDDDARETAEGRGTDVIVGEPAFDAAFLVEAGPKDVVVRLFDAGTRSRMTKLRPIGVHTHTEGLLVEKAGWDNHREIGALIELGATIVESIPRAFDEADRAAQSRTGYRTTVTSQTLGEDRRSEVASVLEKKRAREDRRAQMGCLLAIAILVAVVVAVAAMIALGGANGTGGYDGYVYP